jgi:hypothetical protein
MPPRRRSTAIPLRGFVPWKHLRHGIHPPELFPKSEEIATDFDYRDLGMDIGEEKKVVQGLDASENDEWIELQNVRDLRPGPRSPAG